jgi:protein-export membrane protein SecD
MKTYYTKVGIVFLATLIGIYLLIPSIFSLSSRNFEAYLSRHPKLAKFLPKSALKLGLDLQGGIHLQIGVDTDHAIKNETIKLADNLNEYLKNKKIIPIKINEENLLIKVELNANDISTAINLIKNDFDVLEQTSDVSSNANTIILRTKESWVNRIKTQSIDQALETIRNRIDEFGVVEPSVQKQSGNRIIIQLPGIKDPELAMNIIRRTALLEFKLVDLSMSRDQLDKLIKDNITTLPKDYTVSDLNKTLLGKIPDQTEILFETKHDETTGETIRIPWLIKKKTLLTGEAIEDARIRQDSTRIGNPYQVGLKFSPEDAPIFERITTEHTKELLAIILDSNVYSAPRLNEPISKESAMAGQVVIELGSFADQEKMYKEAQDLVVVLRAGALPAPIIIEENRTVGPSLGKDSIKKGNFSFILSSIMLILFLVVYYKVAGLITCLALVLNVIFILMTLAIFGATLTFPGIAGIILTIGMADDANIIINERVREELRAGRTRKSAYQQGYSRAHLTILDSNITTAIAGVVLYQYGTGPIQGFAVTLLIGLFWSYFTAVWGTRFIVEFLLAKKNQLSV